MLVPSYHEEGRFDVIAVAPNPHLALFGFGDYTLLGRVHRRAEWWEMRPLGARFNTVFQRTCETLLPDSPERASSVLSALYFHARKDQGYELSEMWDAIARDPDIIIAGQGMRLSTYAAPADEPFRADPIPDQEAASTSDNWLTAAMESVARDVRSNFRTSVLGTWADEVAPWEAVDDPGPAVSPNEAQPLLPDGDPICGDPGCNICQDIREAQRRAERERAAQYRDQYRNYWRAVNPSAVTYTWTSASNSGNIIPNIGTGA